MMNAKEIKINENTEICGWTKSKVQALVCSDDRALAKAILLLESLQTAEEKAVRMTTTWNTRGWSMCDARRGGKWAWLLKNGYTLYPTEKEKARQAMTKYWRQLLSAVAIKNGYTPV